MDRRELPGNDASWFQALVADRAVAKHEDTVEEDAVVGGAVAIDTSPAISEDLEQRNAPTDTELGDDGAAADPGHDDTLAVDESLVAPLADDVAGDSDAPALEADGEDATGDAESIDAPTDAGVTTDELHVVSTTPAVIEEESPLENTSEMVGQMWTASDSSTPLDDWEPDDMDRKVASSRSFRWPTVIGILAVVGLIAVGLVLLPSLTQSRADDHLATITTALRDLRAELPDTQNSLSVATDPASEVDELSALTTQLTELAARASALDTATQAELPKAPPLTSSAPIDEIEPIRQRAEPLGTVAMTIQRRISDVVEYRTLMDGFLRLPDLPTTADSAAQAELRVALASAQADSASILADLPDDVSLEAHKSMAREINERFATWQVDYLEALRTADAITAETLIAELDTALLELDDALVAPLAQIRRQTDADLIDLARDIDEVVALADELG